MGVAFQLVFRSNAANTALLLVILLLQATCSVFAAEIRCDSTQIGYNAASQRCPAPQICTSRGVCELFRQDPIGVTRARQFRPIPTMITQSPITAQRRCGKHFAGARCDPAGTIGSCCSRRGWCGSTAAHCSPQNGCQHGCKSNTAVVLGPRYKPGNEIEQTSEPRINTHQIFASFDKPLSAPEHATPGNFRVAGDSGVPAMHAALMPNGKVVFLDKIENYTQIQFENGEYAYSSEWDPVSGEVTALAYKTNAFCCGGSFLASGTLVSVGGNGPLLHVAPSISDGFDGIRFLTRGSSPEQDEDKDWSEPGDVLASERWYASVQTMPDGTLFVASGSLNGLDPTKSVNNNPTYEILDQNGVSSGKNVPMDILVKNQPYFMYPFLHLLRDGSLFVFTATSSQLFDVAGNEVLKELPNLKGMYRTYPNTGGSVLLPLSPENNYEPEVVICGGGAYQDLPSPTDPSCGRIKPLDPKAKWVLDAMPSGRGMVEGTLLPDGTVLWLNGAQRGAEGFGIADTPALDALLYDPTAQLGQRWSRAGTSKIPRLYHSVALLLLDGTVAVAGSNPNEMPILAADVDLSNSARAFPTEFRIEIYSPPYLMGERARRRPDRISLSAEELTADGSTFKIEFRAPKGAKQVKISLYHGGFVTHALHMGHRMVWLESTGWKRGGGPQRLEVRMPDAEWGNKVLPPGPYVVYVVVDGIPGIGKFVMVS